MSDTTTMTPTGAAATHPESLEDGLARHLSAISRRDIDAFAATIASDPVVLVTATGEVSAEREHLLELHRDWFSSTTWSIETRTLHCRDHGDVGSCVLELDYRDTDDDGQLIHEVSVLSLLFELRDGRWLMTQDQNTPRANA